jgi:MFS family permease
VVGGFITRLGLGGMPFLLPLLYQVGLGYSPVQSGLLIMPQPLAAMSLKMTMPWVLNRFGYRRVLMSNTIIIGLIIVLFATIGPETPVWLIALQAFGFGYFSSLQYTSLNTLVYADLSDKDTSMGSSIASTMQQMAISFGIATASLTTAIFIPNRLHPSTAPQMTSGIHKAFVTLGLLTVVSTVVFRGLRDSDGANVSQQKSV